jgi:pimeloyl-ACP methyl ester carboxylesterase
VTVLHHAVRGDGPAVLLVHAGIADSRMWDPFAEHLVAAGLVTIARAAHLPALERPAETAAAVLDFLG